MNTFDVSALISLRRVESVAASPDGTWLAVGVQRLDEEHGSKYVGDLYRVPVDGGDAERLTHGKWNDRAPEFLHDGSLAFLSNRPTGESDDQDDKRSQIFRLPAHGGEPVCMTDEPLGVSAFEAARNADVMCVAVPLLPEVELAEQRATKKDRDEHGPTALVYDDMPVRYWDHWLPDAITHLVTYVDGVRARDLTPNAGLEMRNAQWTLAPDGSFVSLHPQRLASDRIHEVPCVVIDAQSGERRMLAERPRTWLGSPVISPDATRIAITRHVREDGRYGTSDLLIVNAESGEMTQVALDDPEDFSPIAWADNDRLVLSAVRRTHRAAYLVNVATGALTRLTAEAAGGTHLGLTVVGGKVVGIRSTVTNAPEVFSCDLEPESEPRILTNLSGFEGADFASVENHEVISTDGTPVQYRVLRPADDDGQRPCVMAIHGGPISDWGDVWHWRWNSLALAAAGYVVALPNPRGSVGFGNEFIEGIWSNSWGGQCYEDLMAIADELCARPDVDAGQVVAMGGSFGGYMTNWIGSQTDRFCCLITHASIFDLTAFHGVTDMPAWWAFSFGVRPYADRDEFKRYSPVEHVQNWKSPTLIIHGDRDYRVPIGESLSLFEALRFHDVEAKLLVYPDENHWILRPRNVVSWYSTVLDFIDSHT